jgi:hypothetical protein
VSLDYHPCGLLMVETPVTLVVHDEGSDGARLPPSGDGAMPQQSLAAVRRRWAATRIGQSLSHQQKGQQQQYCITHFGTVNASASSSSTTLSQQALGAKCGGSPLPNPKPAVHRLPAHSNSQGAGW